MSILHRRRQVRDRANQAAESRPAEFERASNRNGRAADSARASKASSSRPFEFARASSRDALPEAPVTPARPRSPARKKKATRRR